MSLTGWISSRSFCFLIEDALLLQKEKERKKERKNRGLRSKFSIFLRYTLPPNFIPQCYRPQTWQFLSTYSSLLFACLLFTKSRVGHRTLSSQCSINKYPKYRCNVLTTVDLHLNWLNWQWSCWLISFADPAHISQSLFLLVLIFSI